MSRAQIYVANRIHELEEAILAEVLAQLADDGEIGDDAHLLELHGELVALEKIPGVEDPDNSIERLIHPYNVRQELLPNALEDTRRFCQLWATRCWTAGQGTGPRVALLSLAPVLERAAVTIELSARRIDQLEQHQAEIERELEQLRRDLAIQLED